MPPVVAISSRETVLSYSCWTYLIVYRPIIVSLILGYIELYNPYKMYIITSSLVSDDNSVFQ